MDLARPRELAIGPAQVPADGYNGRIHEQATVRRGKQQQGDDGTCHQCNLHDRRSAPMLRPSIASSTEHLHQRDCGVLPDDDLHEPQSGRHLARGRPKNEDVLDEARR